MHTPVLLEEAIKALNVSKNGVYIDATAGEGGHLKRITDEGGKVLGIDWDESQVKGLKVKNLRHVAIVTGNFADIERLAKLEGFDKVDGVLFDLGLSMRQIKDSGRGFSFSNEEEMLDMRLMLGDTATAEELINSLSVEELYEIFAQYSEELNSRSIAEAIYRARRLRRIERVGDLIRIIDNVVGAKDARVYSRIFQALRIAVNNELDNLSKGLEGAYRLLKPGGRLVVISFHSVEDRIVKQFMRSYKMQEHKSAIKGDRQKRYERSAKLRLLIKK